MHYVGVDYHKQYSYIVVKDGEGRVERRHSGRFATFLSRTWPAAGGAFQEAAKAFLTST